MKVMVVAFGEDKGGDAGCGGNGGEDCRSGTVVLTDGGDENSIFKGGGEGVYSSGSVVGGGGPGGGGGGGWFRDSFHSVVFLVMRKRKLEGGDYGGARVG